jgi:hypothetical protein
MYNKLIRQGLVGDARKKTRRPTIRWSLAVFAWWLRHQATGACSAQLAVSQASKSP